MPGNLDNPEPKPSSATRVSLSRVMTQLDVNLLGNVHGGVMMKLVDDVAGLVATRHSGGPAVTAFVVPKPGAAMDAGELIATLKTRLDGFKVPKSVVFVDELPKTSTGKIQKNVVRARHTAHYTTQG